MRALPAYLFLLGSLSATLATEFIYLHPAPTFALNHEQLSPKEARVALAHHLGLESFEVVGHDLKNNEEAYDIGKVDEFVGKGLGSAAVLSMSEDDAMEILPHYHHATFSTELSSPASSLLAAYADQASHVWETVVSSSSPLPVHHSVPRFLDIFNLPATPASIAFQREASSLTDFVEYGSAESEKFGAFQISSLLKVAEQYGRDSEEYRLAKTTLALIVESLEHTTTKLAVIVSTEPSTPQLNKRQPPQSPLPPPLPSPHEPISAISTCYSSEELCEAETDSCSGHGSCAAATKVGRTCYVCACTSTQSDDGQGRIKTTKWAGNACERKDISSEFVLLAGTTIGLLLFVLGSVALLVAAGEQKLPSVLTGGVVNSKKDN